MLHRLQAGRNHRVFIRVPQSDQTRPGCLSLSRVCVHKGVICFGRDFPCMCLNKSQTVMRDGSDLSKNSSRQKWRNGWVAMSCFFLTQPVRVNYLFRLCALRRHGEEMSNVSWQHSEPRGAFIQPASASRQLLRSLPGQSVNCNQTISCGAQRLVPLLQNLSFRCRSEEFFFYYYYYYSFLCLRFIWWGPQDFFYSFLTHCFRHLCLITMNSPRILQQFTWAVSTPALGSSHANAMAKAE